MRKLVHLNLLRIALVQASILAIMALTVRYDLDHRTPWILQGTISRILGCIMALYGLFWIAWWFFWSAIEGGEEEFELYGVRWAPVATDFVRDGPFKWLRYPLAFGWLEFLWGLGFLVQSTTVVLKVVPILVVAVVIYLVVVVERRKLRAHGSEYRQYRNVAPLIVPRIPNRAAILNLFRRRRRR